MRDAESMLDQLLSAAPERIEESHVRDLLGLADAEAVESFVDVLVRGDAAAGVAMLDQLDERGRDIRALLDQVVEAIRLELVAGLHDPAEARRDPVALAAAGRRLAAIDPNRIGIGGLRFQLELALFRSTEAAAAATPATGPLVQPARRAPARVADRPAPAAEPAGPGTTSTPDAKGSPGPFAPAVPAASAASVVPVASVDRVVTTATGPAGQPAPVPATSAVDGRDLERLAGRWAEVVASVGPATRAVITECRPLAVDGNVVTLGFPETKAFLKDVAARKAKELDSAVGAFLGRPVSVRCVATNIELPPAPAADAELVLAEARRIFADDIVEIGEIS
jgi:DNA polymerase III gamma/tau subunit